MPYLIYNSSPNFLIATNRFINVQTVLQYEDTPLIEVIEDQKFGFETQIPIYHADGTYLAKVTGNRIYKTEAGERAGLKLDILQGLTSCSLDGKVVFELKRQEGVFFKTQAELYTPEGHFLKFSDSPIFTMTDQSLQVLNVTMKDNVVVNFRVGIWVKKDGKIGLGYPYSRDAPNKMYEMTDNDMAKL